MNKLAQSPERELSHFSIAAQSEQFDTDFENDPAQIEKMPVSVILWSNERYHVIDGSHRVAASLACGFTHIPVAIVDAK